MMTVKAGFTNKDAVVAFGCVVFLLMTVGAVGSGGRRRAKEAVCLSNLHQWGTVFAMDVQENQGYFYSGEGSMGFWWVKDLKDQYKDWKNMKIWFCPEATEPVIDENGVPTPTLNIFTAWGIYTGENLGPNGISGSYALNAYVLKYAGR